MARALGTPLIPWQRYVADVAGERRPDGSYEHQVIVVSVPRQTGKTTLIRAIGTHTCLVCGRDFYYTAQTGKDARARWTDLVNVLRKNPALKDRVSIALRGGSESATFRDGGAFRVFAPTPQSLHGYTPPKVAVDEAFALAPEAGELLMGAIGPAQITIVDKQIWIISTMGTAESTFLHDWIDRAMEGMPRVACFVWGAGPDQNPYLAEDIKRFHPGVGFELNGKLLTADDVLEQVDRNTRAEYERAYANRRTLTHAHLIEPDAWTSLGGVLEPPADTRDLTLVYDVAAYRTGSTVLAVWTDRRTGLPAVKIVRAGPGTGWLPEAVTDLARSWRPAQVVAIDSGPVLDITTEIRDAGVKVWTLTEREYAAASGALLDTVADSAMLHDGSPRLAASVTGLVTRSAAVDGIAFSRRHSVGDASAGTATAAGLYAHRDHASRRAPITRFSA